MAHALMDFCLWCIAILWLTQFIASHLRTKPAKRNRKLGAPSIHCERTPDWTSIATNQLTRRQAD